MLFIRHNTAECFSHLSESSWTEVEKIFFAIVFYYIIIILVQLDENTICALCTI